MRGVAAVGGIAAGAALLTACGAGPVRVPAPAPDAATASVCRSLHDRLPEKLHGRSRRASTPRSALVAVWGSPAIALRCGVGRPAALLPTSELVTVNGISWFPEPGDRPATFTAVGRRAYVEVTVPAAYAPAGDVLIDLTGPIKAAVPAARDALP